MNPFHTIRQEYAAVGPCEVYLFTEAKSFELTLRGFRGFMQVGYSIRFEDMTSLRTRIKYMTDGMLLREALVDPLLSRYSVIMIDEAHERSLSTDILLGILKKIRRKRKELRIVISSATLQAEEFVRFFAGTEDDTEGDKGKKKEGEGNELAKIISLEGRCYPVDVLYLEEPTENYVEKAVQTVFDIHLKVRYALPVLSLFQLICVDGLLLVVGWSFSCPSNL